MPVINQENLFSTPLWTAKLDGVNNQPIVDYALELKNTSQGVKISNLGGWQSEKIMPNKETLDILFPVVDGINGAIAEIGRQCKFKSPLRLIDLWFNINEAGDSNMPHIHTNAVLSGTYYLQTDGSGKFEISRPKMDSYTWATIVQNNDHPLASSIFSVIPENNLLVIFPGWVEHAVAPCSSQRISLAFNAAF